MAAAGPSAIRLACLCLCLGALPAAALAKPRPLPPARAAVARPLHPRVFVVPLRGQAGVRFEMGVAQYVEAPLARRARPVPLQIARLAYRKAQVSPLAAKASTRAAQKLGRAAGAQYVLIVEATGQAPKVMAHSVLVDVRAGRAVQSSYFVLPGGRWNAAVGRHLVDGLLAKLDPKAPLRPDPALAGSTDPTDPDAAYSPIEMDPTDRKVHRRAQGLQAHHDDRWRAGLRVSLAPLFLQRTGTIRPATDDPNTVPPCYCGTARNANPYFVGGLLAAELYPMALLRNGDSLWEGLGVHLEAAFSLPQTIVDPNSQATIRSTLVDLKFGAQMRYVLWDSPVATDVQLDGGFALYSFPLRAGGFPGVAFRAGYLGLSAHAPLGLPELVLLGGAHAVLNVQTGDSARDWLGAQQGGTGFNLHAGLRYQIGHFEVGGQYRFERYSSRFTGATAIPADRTAGGMQLQDVTLRDDLNEFTLTGSFTY